MTSTITTIMGVGLCLVVLVGTLVETAPSSRSYNDYEKLREIYDLLLSNEAGRYEQHQMVRKGGRAPSLRLRFGKRVDPIWTSLGPVDLSRDADDE